MKPRYYLPLLAAVLFAAGCRSIEPAPVPAGEAPCAERTFQASSETATRAYVDGLTVLWDASDQLAVFDDAGSEKAVFTLKSGAGTSSATFNGKVSSAATCFYTAYPGASVTAASDHILTLTLPAAQQLVSGGRNLDPAALVGVATTTGSDLSFKNVVAAIRFKLDVDDIVSVSLKGGSDEPLAGTVKVDATTGEVTEVTEGVSEVVLTPAGESFAKGQYVITLLPGSFSRGVVLTFTARDGSTVVRENVNPLTISRSHLLDLAAFINLSETEFSFLPGETREIRVLSQGVDNLAPHSAPEGWTVDASALGSGILKVTAPAAGTSAAGNGVFDLRGTSASGATVLSDDITVRLYGINDKAEFLAFRSLYQGDDPNDNTRLNNPVTDESVIGKYLVDGTVCLNADLAFDDEDLVLDAYIIKYWNLPLEGNGHTVSVDFAGTRVLCAFFQTVGADVRNLHLAGSASITYNGAGYLASLAAFTHGTVPFTLSGVSSSVALSATGKIAALGGLIAHARAGSVTLDGCSYDGTVTYTPAEVSDATAIGGLVGLAGTTLTVKNCFTATAMDLELGNHVLCASESSGVGGLVGVTQAGKTVTLENCENKSAISVKEVSASENRGAFSQTVGRNGSGADLSGCTESGSVTFEEYVGASIAFASTDPVSLAYGASVQIPFTYENLKSATPVSGAVTEAPAGWTIDFAGIAASEPYITVTAPAQEAVKAGTAAGIGELTIAVTTSTGETATNVVKPVVRLYGINSKAEFTAFKTAYGPSANAPNLEGLDAWLVDGAITLNTDIAITTDDLATYYVIKFLDLPLEGNDRTITYNVTSTQAMAAFCQGLHADVRNLNFDGTIVNSAKAGEVSMLAARGINTNSSSRKAKSATVTNVHIKPTAIISYEYNDTGSTAFVGGFSARGTEANSTLTFRNCSVEGTVRSTLGAPQGLGGFAGSDGNGTNVRAEFYSCTFSGTLELTQTVNKAGSIRVGGFVGDGARQSYFEGCTSSGTLRADMGGFVFNPTNKASGLGGFVGRTTASTSTLTMYCGFNDCTFSGSITATNMLAGEAELGWTSDGYDDAYTFGQIVGNKAAKMPEGLDTCHENGSITYSFAQ